MCKSYLVAWNREIHLQSAFYIYVDIYPWLIPDKDLWCYYTWGDSQVLQFTVILFLLKK